MKSPMLGSTILKQVISSRVPFSTVTQEHGMQYVIMIGTVLMLM